jgi:hypothetical protein
MGEEFDRYAEPVPSVVPSNTVEVWFQGHPDDPYYERVPRSYHGDDRTGIFEVPQAVWSAYEHARHAAQAMQVVMESYDPARG